MGTASTGALARIGAIGAIVAAIATGCGGGAGAYCDTMVESSDVAATVFNPVIPGMTTAPEIAARLTLLAEVQEDVPADLQEDYDVWRAHLEDAETALADPATYTELFAAGNTDEVSGAQERLFDHYVDTCL